MTAASAPSTCLPSTQAARARIWIFTIAAIIASLGLAAAAWARIALAGSPPGTRTVDLRLAYNPGVSFGLGASLPVWAVVAVTGLIASALAVAAWKFGPRGSALQRAGVAAVLGGAFANLADRAISGSVTDYFHTGWWPTFNLADVCIVAGAACIAAGFLLAKPRDAAPCDDVSSHSRNGSR